MALLEIKDLVKRFDGRTVLNGVTFELNEGQTKVIMGPSGCGKSTLLRCLNRLLEPDGGQIFFRGEDVALPDTDIRQHRQSIGFVFQQFALYRHLTVLENITLGLRKLRRLSTAAADKKAAYQLERMEMGAHRLKYPAHLSVGQKQRVAIARALAMDPAVLFFDEPTSALDPLMSLEVAAVINQLRSENVTMLCVTHDVSLARHVTDRVIFLDDGQVKAEDSAEQLLTTHADPRIRQFFGQPAALK